MVHISQSPGCGCGHSNIEPELTLQSPATGCVCCPVSVVFSGQLLQVKIFTEYTSGTDCLGPIFHQRLWHMVLENFLNKLEFNRCHLMDFVLQSLYSLLTISIRPSGCRVSGSIEAPQNKPTLCYANHFSPIYKDHHCSMNCMNLLCV